MKQQIAALAFFYYWSDNKSVRIFENLQYTVSRKLSN
jgi:hypothetical protein